MSENNIGSQETVKQDSASQADWLQPVAVAIAALLIMFARAPDRLTHGFLWGEDGKIFLSQAYENGVASIFIPYAQYFHFLPRTVAVTYSYIGHIDRAPRPFVWICALIQCMACVYLFTRARRSLPPSIAWAFGLAPVLIPQSGEVLLNITNIQWIVAPCLLVLLWEEFCFRPNDRRETSSELLRVATIVATTLTGPFGLLFLPIVVIGLILTRQIHRSPRACAAIAAYIVSATVQLAAILAYQHTQPKSVLDESARVGYLHFPWPNQLLRHMALEFLMPQSWIAHMGTQWPYFASACALAVIVCLVLSGKEHRSGAVVMVAIGIFLWMVAMVRTGVPQIDQRWDAAGGRYFIIPFVLFAWALLLSLATTPFRMIRVLSGALLACMLWNSAAEFYSPVYLHAGSVYRSESGVLRMSIAPSSEWFIDVKPSWLSE
ncbi:hypothetical protein SAMN04487926_111242 [Paraburkholderia steynii]|uniref:Glycosyltransferase RgtA/B/C/D-like domain-containing protein n=1 Tax=Paraburkholderia steynii TaxID=1245441 RepID=A0A7Z7B832_9BURK|nr:hypothetical protein [Paraburkholderia steynii]SDI07230.1 hypothetical protein SAMN04487926_111242 [Paraburkholderia steynii]